jgi:WD40 repeat protein
MARSRTIKLLEILLVVLFAGAVFLFILFLFYSPCADYQPHELILNCFSASEIWDPFAASPDGKQIVAASFGQFYWIDNWDDKQGASKTAKKLAICPIQDIGFSDNGRRLGIYAGARKADEISIFDAHSRELVNCWRVPPCEHSHELVLSHDGDFLAIQCPKLVEVWESSTGQLLNSIPTPENLYPACLCSSKGGVLIAYYEENYLQITICGLEKPFKKTIVISTIRTPGPDIFNGAAISPDGSLLGVNLGFRTINVYQVCDSKLVAEFKNAGGMTSSNHFEGFVFSPDAKFLATSNPGNPDDDTVTIWTIRLQKELCTLRGFRSTPHYLAFGPASKTLITRDGHAVAVWDISGFGRDGD